MPGSDTPTPVAEVQVGNVTFDGDLPLYRDDNDAPVADLMIHNHYERDGHAYVAGLTSPDPFNGSLVGVFKLASVTETWVAEWTACNVGVHPPVPDPTAPPGWVLLDVNASLAMTSAGPGGDPVYRISGCYVYARTAPLSDDRRALTEGFTYPYAPWLQEGGAVRKVPASSLSSLMLEERTGYAGGGGSNGNGQGLTGFTGRQ